VGAPKIKVYLLDEGYDQNNDLDVQNAVGDELLPVVDKSQILNALIETLTGLTPHVDQPLIEFELAGGRASYNLLPPDGTHDYYYPDGVDFVDFLRGPVGALEFRVLDVDDNVVPATDYTIAEDPPGTPAGIEFVGTPPTSPKVSAYLTSTTSDKWALPESGAYAGTNPAFNKVLITVDAGAPESVAAEGDDKAYVTRAGATAITATMWATATKSRYFCGAHQNWVGDHLNMWPDVFIGLVDYPGDRDVNQTGDPLPDELKPGYVDIGQYQINFRDGLVTFPDEVDTEELNEFDQPKLVRANYAHLAGIGNVTGQKLDVIGGTDGKHFKATSDLVHPASIGKRWVGRDDLYVPMNVYAKGALDTTPQLTPTPVKILPWEQLTVKTAP
jgi:hypothetical protein